MQALAIRHRLLFFPRRTRLFASLHPLPKPLGQQREEPWDPRPPWIFRMSRLLTTFLIPPVENLPLYIPAVFFYAVFFVDFGEREHVFMPARRWAAKQKAAFFTLSPSELRLLEAERAGRSPPTPPEQQTSNPSS